MKNFKKNKKYLNKEIVSKWIKELDGTRGRSELILNNRTLLVVMDPQKIFCHKNSPAFLPSWEEAEINCMKLINKFKKNNLGMAVTRHFMDENLEYIPFNNFFNKKLLKKDPLSEIIDSFKKIDPAIFEKDNFSLFSAKGVDHILTAIDYIVFCGVQANICIISSSLDCANFGITPIVAIDGICAKSEIDHISALRVISSGHGYVMSCDEIIKKVEELN